MVDTSSITSNTSRLPHGYLTGAPVLLTTIAYILASTGNYKCNFLWRADTAAGSAYVSPRGIGLWSFTGIDGYCYYYPSYLIPDTTLKAARAFNVLSTTIGFFCLMMIYCSACVPFHKSRWGCVGIFLILCSLFVGLTLLMKQSRLCTEPIEYTRNGVDYELEGGCSLNTGANCAIAAIVFFFLAGCSVLAIPPPDVPIPEPTKVKETVVTTEEVKPDGTKVTTTRTEYSQV